MSDKVYYIIDGREYEWNGWYGCQLSSVERYLPIGHVRAILGRPMYVFSHKRLSWMGPDWAINWSLFGDKNINKLNEQIKSLRDDLKAIL